MASSGKPEESEAFDYEEELNESGEDEAEVEEEELELSSDHEENLSHIDPPKEVVFDRKKNKAVNEDVWDDSALIAAWDAAVEEYELYHSGGSKAISNSDKPSEPEKETKIASTPKVPKKAGIPASQREKVRKSAKRVEPPKSQKSHTADMEDTPANDDTQPPIDYYGNQYGYYGHSVDPYYQQPLPRAGSYPYTNAHSAGQSPVPPQPPHNPYSTGAQHPPQPSMGYYSSATHASGMPPPPPVATLTEDEELANLLMAWYYSGYYTGLYQARRRHQ